MSDISVRDLVEGQLLTYQLSNTFFTMIDEAGRECVVMGQVVIDYDNKLYVYSKELGLPDGTQCEVLMASDSYVKVRVYPTEQIGIFSERTRTFSKEVLQEFRDLMKGFMLSDFECAVLLMPMEWQINNLHKPVSEVFSEWISRAVEPYSGSTQGAMSASEELERIAKFLFGEQLAKYFCSLCSDGYISIHIGDPGNINTYLFTIEDNEDVVQLFHNVKPNAPKVATSDGMSALRRLSGN